MSRTTTLQMAENALARGAYKECLLALEPLLKERPFKSHEGAEIGVLMITALIGQGENQKAISICETLLKHNNDSIRQQAKQFISILKAPELDKPQEWSINIPSLQFETPLKAIKPNNNNEKSVENPPTGSTKHLKPGFTIASLIIFLLLSIFLSS